jgi:uncharacterized UBP type Zn finger protein
MPVSETALNILLAYGFSENSSKRALNATNNSVDLALDWLVEHRYDTDLEMTFDVEIKYD